MKITYIGHSGFSVELEQSVLLFDYYQGEIPSFPDGKKLYVFASHRHGDHFNPEIFSLAERYLDVQYVFSRDIWRSRVPEKLQKNVVQMKANTEWTDGADTGKNESHGAGVGEADGCEAQGGGGKSHRAKASVAVRTLRSTDEGVAFLVQTEGKTLYHAGDLNNWRWEGEPEEWNRKMEADYKAFLEPIRGQRIDAAFVPLDPRQEQNYALGMDYFLELTDAKKVYPMHCWEDYSVIDRWRWEHPDSPYRDRIVSIDGRGANFVQR